MNVLDLALAKYCKFYKVSFQKLENIMELMDGDALQSTADFVLADPPYYRCRLRNRPTSVHVVFSAQNMIDLINVCFEATKIGNHGHMS